jgi:hypothetical protein
MTVKTAGGEKERSLDLIHVRNQVHENALRGHDGA